MKFIRLLWRKYRNFSLRKKLVLIGILCLLFWAFFVPICNVYYFSASDLLDGEHIGTIVFNQKKSLILTTGSKSHLIAYGIQKNNELRLLSEKNEVVGLFEIKKYFFCVSFRNKIPKTTVNPDPFWWIEMPCYSPVRFYKSMKLKWKYAKKLKILNDVVCPLQKSQPKNLGTG